MAVSQTWVWRLIGIAIGALIGWYGPEASLLGGAYLFPWIHDIFPPGEPGTNTNTGEQVQAAAYIIQLWVYFYPLIGAATALIFWQPDNGSRLERVIVVILFAAVFPLFMLNILYHDHLIALWVQASLDLIIATCSAYFVLVLSKQRLNSLILIVVRAIAIGAIGMFLVLVPIYYATIWMLHRMGMFNGFGTKLDQPVLLIGSFALAAAALLYAHKSRLDHALALVTAAPSEQRLKAIEIVLARSSIDTQGLSESAKIEIVHRQIALRRQRMVYAFYSLLIFVVLHFVISINI